MAYQEEKKLWEERWTKYLVTKEIRSSNEGQLTAMINPSTKQPHAVEIQIISDALKNITSSAARNCKREICIK